MLVQPCIVSSYSRKPVEALVIALQKPYVYWFIINLTSFNKF